MIIKPIIGIILKKSKSETGRDILLLYEAISYAIKTCGGISIGINNSLEYLYICNGFIFQGGDDIENEDLIFMRHILNLNKPILCICLGMQELGCLFGGTIAKASKKHHSNLDKAHTVYINKNSKLYQIIGKDKIEVNSRHYDKLEYTSAYISAISDDGTIEAIEIPNYKFGIGIQWHPENLIDIDGYSKLLFMAFINSCLEEKNEFE